jgi:hypothetical protein
LVFLNFVFASKDLKINLQQTYLQQPNNVYGIIDQVNFNFQKLPLTIDNIVFLVFFYSHKMAPKPKKSKMDNLKDDLDMDDHKISLAALCTRLGTNSKNVIIDIIYNIIHPLI